MSKQEFEPRQHQSDEDLYQLQYPYAWSEQDQQEGLPRDEAPGSYRARDGRYEASNAAQVPWWARPQPQRGSPVAFIGIVLIVVFLAFVVGGLGILGFIFGSLGHILAVIVGAIFALFIFFLLLIFLILALIIRALRRVFNPRGRVNWRRGQSGWRYTWRDW